MFTTQINTSRLMLMSALLLGSAFFTSNAMAEGGSVHHSGQASKHSVLAAGHAIGSTAKVASAVVAAPILASGAVTMAIGSATMASGVAIADSGASISDRMLAHEHKRPLVITDIIITADPAPNQVLNTQTQKVAEHRNQKTTQITTKSTSKTTIIEDKN